MKFLKRLIVLLLIIGIGTAVFSFRAPVEVMGDASQALKLYYNVKKADEVNSKKIVISRDGQALAWNLGQKPYMTQNMELMVPAKDAARLFQCDVDLLDDVRMRFLDGEHTVILSKGSNTYLLDDVQAEFVDPLIEYSQLYYVSVRLLAESFGYGYAWDFEKNQADIAASDSNNSDLPVAYDMRQENRVTPVRSQGNLGTCWAFAALGALESSLMPHRNDVFAVDHMSFLSGFNMTQQDGGDYNMALAYLAAWKGPVLEAKDPYGDGVTDESLSPVVHLQEAVNIEAKNYDLIKRTILKSGGIQSSFYSDMETANSNSSYYNSKTKAYYYPGGNVANHDVVIVGWDDEFPKESFNSYPKNNGAFICRNSWGPSFGDGGYFYISYEDMNIGVNNIVYTRVDSIDNYKNNYQSDLLGWVGTIGYGNDTAWFSNVFQTFGDEKLKAVSFYTTGSENYYDIYVIRDFTDAQSFGKMEYVKSGYISQAGYYTKDFAKAIDLSAGSRFAVVVRLTTKDSLRPAAIEYDTGKLTSHVDITDGEGYLSYTGTGWERVEDVYACNVCLKAFTE